MKHNKYDDIQGEREEFNMMQLYLFRINKIQDRMDEAAGNNDVVKFYMELRSLLSNCELKFSDENIQYIDLKKQIIDFGKQLRSQVSTDIFDKNKFHYLERALELATELRKAMNKAGMIYPKQIYKTIEELAEADY